MREVGAGKNYLINCSEASAICLAKKQCRLGDRFPEISGFHEDHWHKS